MLRVKVTDNRNEIIKAIEVCDKAFANPILQRKNCTILIEKIIKYATFYVTYWDNEICGYCAIYMNDYDSLVAYISLLVVNSKYQNRHIGKTLISKIVSRLYECNFKSVKLEVDKKNSNAIRFYLKNGFTVCDETEKSYFMILNLMERKNEFRW